MDVIRDNSLDQRLLLVNGRICAGGRVIDNGCLLVGSEGRIEAVGGTELASADAPVRDVRGSMVLPGFIDLHVHGGGGFQMMDGTYEGIAGMSRFHAAHGTTSFLAATDSASERAILKALRNAAEAAGKGLDGAELFLERLDVALV